MYALPRTFIARSQIPGKVELRKYSKRYVGVGGSEMAICGKIKIILEVNEKKVETNAIVTTLNYSLIGRTELIKLGLLDGFKDVCIKRIKSGINNEENLEKIKVNLEREIKIKCPNLIDGKKKYPDAASSIMPMIKKLDQPVDKNNLRIVADYSLFNRNFKLNCYKMKSVDDVLKKVGNMMNSKKVYISTFNVQDCYGCIRIDKSDQSKVCINSHVGIFRLCRLSQGVSVSPPICQEIMDKIDKQVTEFCRQN
uniref:Reverse transcriptase domain-containing protein n=1 Tax=Strongyloides venezuelensis TaxID=75913 RepID=A0A0K0FJR9_STRVS